jgi:segregation and condensation protein B
MEANKLEMTIEALLFVSRTPLPAAMIAKAAGVDAKLARDALASLSEFYRDRGIVLEEVAGGWQLRTNPACAESIKKHLQTKPVRLTKQALETMSMIAYMQPVTKARVEEIRGVDSSAVIKFLMDHGFVRIIGQKEVPGRPFLYGTTRYFLEFFGLKSLSDMPRLQEQIELTQEDMVGIDEGGGEAEEEEAPAQDSDFLGEISTLLGEIKKEDEGGGVKKDDEPGEPKE